VLSRGQIPEFGAMAINACERDCVTAPVDLNTLLFQGEEDDHATYGDGAGEGSGCDVVILGPPA